MSKSPFRPTKEMVELARMLRRNETPAERALWNELRAHLNVSRDEKGTADAVEWALEHAGVQMPKSSAAVAELGFTPSDVSAVRNAIEEHRRQEEQAHSMAVVDEVPATEEEETPS